MPHPVIFIQKKPKNLRPYWLRLLFAPWQMARFIVNFTLGRLFSFPSMPVKWISLFKDYQALIKQQEDILSKAITSKEIVIERFSVQTHDGAKLDTQLYRPPTLQNTPAASCLWIIKVNGNSQCYELEHQQSISDAKCNNAIVLGFNYRGINQSSGSLYCAKHLITDLSAQVDYLLARGVPSEQIYLDGWSQGGGVASVVAYQYYRRGHIININSYLSYSRMSHAARGLLTPKTTYKSYNPFILLAQALVP